MGRFSTRDLIWVTVLVAVLSAWWLDQSLLSQRIASIHHLMMCGP